MVDNLIPKATEAFRALFPGAELDFALIPDEALYVVVVRAGTKIRLYVYEPDDTDTAWYFHALLPRSAPVLVLESADLPPRLKEEK